MIKATRLIKNSFFLISIFSGGEGGSRTLERLAPLLVFETSALDHYATSPRRLILSGSSYYKLKTAVCQRFGLSHRKCDKYSVGANKFRDK